MPKLIINDFSGGLVSNNSVFDLEPNQFQTFTEVNNEIPGKIKKTRTTSDISNTISTTTSVRPFQVANGFTSYRTEYDGSGTPAQTSTVWYIDGTDDGTYANVARYDQSDLTSGSWTDIISSGSSTWSAASLPNFDYLVHNQVLRIADGVFSNDNTTKWYGHIKRDQYGQDIDYGGGYPSKFLKSTSAGQLNAWYLIDSQIVAPTVVQMTSPFDGGDDVDARGIAGLFIHFPTNTNGDQKIMDDIDDADDPLFSGQDRYTVTFIYDYVQESTLGKNTDGTIGVIADDYSTANNPRRIPVINVVHYVYGSKERITSINLYWKPDTVGNAKNIDWYLVGSLDLNKGWSDDERATQISEDAVGFFSKLNMGYWLPCPDLSSVTTSTNIAALDGGDADTWATSINIGGAGYNIEAGDIVWAGFSSGATDPLGLLKLTDTMIGLVDRLEDSSTDVEFASDLKPVNYQGENITDPTTFTVGTGTRYLYGVEAVSTKISTWYIPNDGIFGYTYSYFTGRAAEDEIKAIKYAASAELNNRAFYGNIDTTDENEQTVREKSRIYYTEPGLLDCIFTYNHFDVGRNDGDKIVGMGSLNGRLYIFKSRNIYIYNVQSPASNQWYLERHYAGVGTQDKGAIALTPYGYVVADQRQVSLVTPSSIKELSFPIRDSWQYTDTAASISYVIVGYDGKRNKVLVIRVRGFGKNNFSYDFDLRSWDRRTLGYTWTWNAVSNMITGENLYLQYMQDVSITTPFTARVVELGSGANTTETLTLKSKRFTLDTPEFRKRFNRIYMTYISDAAITVNLYIDGSGSAALASSFASQATLDTVGKSISLVGKSIEVEVTTTEATFQMDDIMIDYEVIGKNP